MVKTNVMRILDAEKINYVATEYEVDEQDLSGVHVAQVTNIPAEQMFKTLVAKGEKKGIVVFLVPVEMEINLKKAASEIGDKKIEMLPLKDLLNTTGYIRGGCSPIGMKKKYPTYVDELCQMNEQITVSAGVRGCQITLDVEDLLQITEASLCDIVK